MNIDCPPGTLMAITGHMDCTYRNSADDPKLFTGMPYHDKGLVEWANLSAEKIGLKLASGHYCWTLGPSYETTAEIEDMQDQINREAGLDPEEGGVDLPVGSDGITRYPSVDGNPLPADDAAKFQGQQTADDKAKLASIGNKENGEEK